MGTPADDRLDRLVAFIVEIDRLKGVLRQTMVTGSERHENDAEHSWHLALTAVLLAEYACDEVDLLRVNVQRGPELLSGHVRVEGGPKLARIP